MRKVKSFQRPDEHFEESHNEAIGLDIEDEDDDEYNAG
jgi:hypothetical protein